MLRLSTAPYTHKRTFRVSVNIDGGGPIAPLYGVEGVLEGNAVRTTQKVTYSRFSKEAEEYVRLYGTDWISTPPDSPPPRPQPTELVIVHISDDINPGEEVSFRHGGTEYTKTVLGTVDEHLDDGRTVTHTRTFLVNIPAAGPSPGYWGVEGVRVGGDGQLHKGN